MQRAGAIHPAAATLTGQALEPLDHVESRKRRSHQHPIEPEIVTPRYHRSPRNPASRRRQWAQQARRSSACPRFKPLPPESCRMRPGSCRATNLAKRRRRPPADVRECHGRLKPSQHLLKLHFLAPGAPAQVRSGGSEHQLQATLYLSRRHCYRSAYLSGWPGPQPAPAAGSANPAHPHPLKADLQTVLHPHSALSSKLPACRPGRLAIKLVVAKAPSHPPRPG